MHIGFRTSGGRGEYEVVGTHSGYTANSLDGWSIYMAWPDGIVRDTGLWLDPGESGKARLRSTLVQPFQIGRILSAMLMLPDPTRSLKTTPATWPIITAKKYTVTQVGFSPESDFAEIADRVTFAPSWIQVANSASQDFLGVDARWMRIEVIYQRVSELPTDGLQHAATSHRDYLASGKEIDQSLSSVVSLVCRELSLFSGSYYEHGSDPLPVLERLLGIESSEGPSLPAPSELSDDEPEISARSAHEYRLARVRGSSGRRFSELVRALYQYRCAFCGGRFGAIEGVRSGIDAAHILAWAKHDLDVPSNGIALCKLHHWAFDAGVLMLDVDQSGYLTRFTNLSLTLDEPSREKLGTNNFRIPEDWLPDDPQLRPSSKYLGRLYADLGVTFLP